MTDNITPVCMMYKEHKKMVLVSHSEELLSYSDVLSAVIHNFSLYDDNIITIYDGHTNTVLDDNILPLFCKSAIKYGTLCLKISVENLSQKDYSLESNEYCSMGNNSVELYNENLATCSNTYVSATKEVCYEILESKQIFREFIQNECVLLKKKIISGEKLDKPLRNKMARVIIEKITNKNPDYILTSVTYTKIANLIVSIFPNELTVTYYCPSSSISKFQRGKLYNAFNKYRTKLQEQNVITKRRRKNAPIFTNVTIDLDEIVEGNDITLALESLKTNVNNYDEVEALWKKTHNYRCNLLKSNTDMSTADYFVKFPCLTQEYAHKLIDLDMQLKFNLNLESMDIWDIFYENVINNSKKNKNESVKYLLNKIENFSINETSKKCYALAILAYVIPIGGKKASGKNNTNLKTTHSDNNLENSDCYRINKKNTFSKLESQLSFIQFFEDVVEAELDRNSSIYKQPRLQYIGNHNLSVARLLIADQIFVFEDLLYAVEILFKIFWTIDIDYPRESPHIWEFLQFGIFHFDIGINEPSPGVLTCINDNSR